MNFPLISEYIESIKLAEYNFASLTNLRLVFNDDGEPVMSSGNFAVVFKMFDIVSGGYYAVKCFTREQEGRKEAYKKISSLLTNNKSDYLVNVKYLEYELFVDSKNSIETEFPVLLMDWVEGMTIDKYIKTYMGNSFELHDLCVSFGLMCKWLSGENFAHGDLKPDNIIVRPDGSIVLIDYDGMYVPSMDGQKAREIGSVNYRHPLRTESDFDKHIDDFAMATIALSLKAISICYGILDKFNCEDSFLFTQNDYMSLEDSEIFRYLITLMYKDASITPYISVFMLAYQRKQLDPVNFDFGESYTSSLLTRCHLIFTRKNEPMDENGVIYSFDGTRVLSFDYEASDDIDVKIKEGVICICEGAFSSFKKRKLNLSLPESLRFFTKDSFQYNYINLNWKSPWFTYKEGFIYTKDFTGCIMQHLVAAKIDYRVKNIERCCFHYMDVRGMYLPSGLQKIKGNAFDNAITDDDFFIPENVLVIGQSAFCNCKGLRNLFFNQKLLDIGEWCFSFCENLETVSFPGSCKIRKISNHVFHDCNNLKEVKLPSLLYSIEDEAFQWCLSLESIVFPESLTNIGNEAFNMWDFFHKDERRTSRLKNLLFPKRIEVIGNHAFDGCSSLNQVVVLGEKTEFGEGVFNGCYDLITFEAKTLKGISPKMFSGCTNLSSVDCPILESVEKLAFESCINLTFQMPYSLRRIGFGAFNGVKHIVTNDDYEYENGLLCDKEKRTLVSCNQTSKKIDIPKGIVTTSKEAFAYIPEVLVLPNTLLDESIRDLLGLKTKYVQLPMGRNIDCFGEAIAAKMVGDTSVFIDNEGVLYSENKKTLIKFPMELQMRTYSILHECEIIGDNAFEGDVDYDPEFGTTHYSGNELEELFLSPNLKVIGINALNGCRKLKRLMLPEGIVELQDSALKGCRSITQIILPSSLSIVGANALPAFCESVKSNSSKFCCYGDCLLSENNEILWISSSIKQFDLPPNVKYMGKDCIAYHDCIVSCQGELLITIPEIESFHFPNGVKTIARKSFCQNKRIKELRIPEGVTSIDYYAFSCNQGLKSIYLPSTIEYIGNLHTYQGWGRKYIEDHYPKEIHIPKGMKRHFLSLMPDLPENRLIDDMDN